MNVLVTGGSGRIGRHVVRDLLAAGHEVLSVDVVPPREQLCPTLLVDLTDAGQVYGAVARARADAVVHMGAWADAGVVPDTRTYADNVTGTFNVFQACADLGVKRIVSASSAQVYGFHSAPPVYIPADENHPLRPDNCYALTKVAGESAADYFVANDGLTILSFRFMGVRAPEEIPPEIEVMAQHPATGAGLLWMRTDARDAAMACRLAVEREEVLSGPYNITGPRVALNRPSAELVREYFGSKTKVVDELLGYAPPLSCQRAEEAFGYRPQYAWTETQQHLEH